MKIYAISGLGADHRVFQYLKLDYELVCVNWVAPQSNEHLSSYAKRLSRSIDTEEDYIILGVSFGGLVAVEISKLLSPRLTILISSAETYYELRKMYSLVGHLKFIRWIPKLFFDPPRKLAYWLFGTHEKALLNNILNDTNLDFAKWAVSALTTWRNRERIRPILKISGSHNKLVPSVECGNTVTIAKGEHFMIVDRAIEISEIINQRIEELRIDLSNR